MVVHLQFDRKVNVSSHTTTKDNRSLYGPEARPLTHLATPHGRAFLVLEPTSDVPYPMCIPGLYTAYLEGLILGLYNTRHTYSDCQYTVCAVIFSISK